MNALHNYNSTHNQHRFTTCPASRLTADVLYVIFLELKRSEIVHKSCKVVPSLSHVCRFWRDVAIESPLLWTTIHMHCLRTPQHHHWVVAHMRRSKNCMVDLYLYLTRPLADVEVEYIFQTNGHRIRSLTVSTSSPHLTCFIWPRFHNTMPLLQSYNFSANNDIVLSAARDPPREARPFPFPVIVKYDIVWSNWDATGLTTLSLKHISPDDHLPLDDLSKILLTCKHTLRDFEFVGASPSPSTLPSSGITPMTFPDLERLTLTFADSLSDILLLMRAPNLKSFSLRDLWTCPDLNRPFPKFQAAGVPTDAKHVFGFLGGVKLTELSISGDNDNYAPNEFRTFLLSQPTIKSLSIYGCSDWYYNTLFDTTIRVEDMLPALSHLHVVQRGVNEQVLGFLGRRITKKLAPLDKLTIARSGEALVLLERELFTEGAKVISVVSDPIPHLYVSLDEQNIMVDGVVVTTITPPSSPVPSAPI